MTDPDPQDHETMVRSAASVAAAVAASTPPRTPLEEAAMRQGLVRSIADALFVFLPIVVISLVQASQATLFVSFSAQAWSFGAAVLAGQAIVGMMMAFTTSWSRAHEHAVALLLAGVIVVVLVPALTILTIRMLHPDGSVFLAIAAFLLFVVGLAAFLLAGVMRSLAALEREGR